VAAADVVTFRDNPDESRYEVLLDGALAGIILYRERPGVVTLVHTEVRAEFEGRGLGARLVAFALGDIRERGLRLVPLCPFVSAYLERHPEDADLVARGATGSP
jgi:predicted GNAT family acetyltransferase